MKENSKSWKDWDAEHICDRIEQICHAFELEIDWSDFVGVRTFGDICDAICVSFAWRYRDGGRLRQAFYEVREAIAVVQGVDVAVISADTRLEELFPRARRRERIKRMEEKLGYWLHLLEPKQWVILTMVFVMAVSFFSMVRWWMMGLFGMVGGLAGYWLAVWFGKEFRYSTVGSVARELMRNRYIYGREAVKGNERLTRPFGGGKAGLAAVNQEQIVKIIEETFRKELGLAPWELRRDAEIF
jgi:hypothetical protein